jgi:hypothetical protein
MPSSGILRRVAPVFLRSVLRLLVTANVVPSSPILVTLMKAIRPSGTSVLTKEHGVTSQKTAFTTVNSINLLRSVTET